MSAKIHFRDYNPKQMILFPQRLDKDIAENDPVRICSGERYSRVDSKRETERVIREQLESV